MQAFDRFVSRRGRPCEVYSDHGTNFVGFRKLLMDTEIEVKMAQQGITWHLIPPRAPHQGGLWEAAVKSAKTCIRQSAFKNSPWKNSSLYLPELKQC